MCTAALGRFGASTPARKTLTKGAPCAFDKAMVFPATECDLAADSLSLSVASGGGVDVLGEANLPLAALYRAADGGKKARKSPFTIGLVPPGSATGVDATSPLGIVEGHERRAHVPATQHKLRGESAAEGCASASRAYRWYSLVQYRAEV